MNLSRTRGLVAALSVVALSTLASPSFAQSFPWTSAATTGTVDESDMAIADLNNGLAAVKSTAASPSTLNIRYNIVALQDVVGGSTNPYGLRARFRDNGSGAQVRLNLKSYGFNGITSTIAVLDSNDYPSNTSYQNQTLCLAVPFDFENFSYFIDAELIKSSSSGTPALGLMKVQLSDCIN